MSFFTPSKSSSSTSSKRQSTPTTSASVLLAKDNEIVVWANRPRNRQGVEDKWQNTLMYYSFFDDRRFTNLDSLLTQLAPMSMIHVACTEKFDTAKTANTPSAKKKARETKKMLEDLELMINSRADLAGDDDDQDDHPSAAAAPTSLCHIHKGSVKADKERIESTMSQLLLSSSQLSFRGDVEIASHDWLLKGLGFWLQAEGFWQSGVPDHMLGRFHLQAGTMDSHLLLDRTAASCIHLLPPPNAGAATVVGGKPHNNSLLGILSQPAATKMGKRLMERWLRQPLVDLKGIVERQDAVELLVNEGVGRDQLKEEGLRNFSSVDIAKLAATLGSYGEGEQQPAGSTQAALKALYQLYLLNAQKLPLLLDGLQNVVSAEDEDFMEEDSKDAPKSLLKSIFVGLQRVSNELARSTDLVEAVLDMDMAPREYLIKSSFKEELADVRAELDNVEASIDECHQEMNQLWAETKGLDGDSNAVRLETVGDNDATKTWQFRLVNTNDAKELIDGPLKSRVQVHRLLKNGVYFSTKEINKLSTKKRDLIAEYDRHQKQVVQDAMKVAGSYQGPLERTNELVAQLDVLVSLAHVAAYSPHGYCRPTMTDGEEDGMGIILQGARHPCVELQEHVAEYIPNDVKLIFGDSSFFVLTGPNMGGKSTFIRSLGAIVAMAQIGSFVPCSSATINICHHILARVGAGDLQDRGISTFMAEMLEASSILKTATKRSLIVIDELGRGTSTFDGYGLARAISEYIIQKVGCMSVFATHFHEMTRLEETEKSVKNFHVSATTGPEGLAFLYEVKPGPCLESFGIHVAEMARLPQAVIAEAKRKALELENFDYKKQRMEDGSMEVDKEEFSVEEKSKAKDFMRRFKALPLDKMATKEEKMAALRQLVHQSQ